MNEKRAVAAPKPPRSRAAEATRSVGFLLVPGFALMSYTAAVEPLRAANLISGRTLYRWWHAAPGGKPVAGLERGRHHSRCRRRYRPRRRHAVRLRRRQPRHLQRQIGVRLAEKARAARRHHRRHFRRALHPCQGRAARRPPGDAALGASAVVPRGVSGYRRCPIAVRDRRQPHHLLRRHLGARHDGGPDRARSRTPACRGGRAIGSCTRISARAWGRSAWT